MKGLLIKDFYMIKKQFSFFMIVPVLFFTISIFMGDSAYFSYYSVAILSVLPISIIGYDEAYKWNKYETILPISRKSIVGEKYLLTLLLIIPMIFIESIIIIIAFSWSAQNIISWISLTLFCGLIIPSIMLPVLMKFGYHKGKIINLIIIAILSSSIAIINITSISGDNKLKGEFSPNSLAVILAFAAIIIFTVSYLISCKIFSKREF